MRAGRGHEDSNGLYNNEKKGGFLPSAWFSRAGALVLLYIRCPPACTGFTLAVPAKLTPRSATQTLKQGVGQALALLKGAGFCQILKGH